MLQTMKKFTKEAYQNEKETGKRNEDFIHRICDECGEEDLVLSEIILKANYGSEYDGETIHYYLCSDCFDILVKNIISTGVVMSVNELLKHRFNLEIDMPKRKLAECCTCGERTEGSIVIEFDEEEDLPTSYVCERCKDVIIGQSGIKKIPYMDSDEYFYRNSIRGC